MLGNARKHFAEVCFRIVPVELHGAQQAVDRRGAIAAGVAAGEQEVLAPKRDASQRPLGRIVVDLDAAVIAIPPQCIPASERVANRLCRRGFLRKRRNSVWYIRYDVPGPRGQRDQRHESFTGTKMQAEDKLAEILGKVQKGEFVLKSSSTLGDYIDHFMRQKELSGKCSPKTLERYESMIRTRIRPSLGDIPLSQLQHTDLLAAYEQWSAKRLDKSEGRLSGRSLRHAHDLVRHILNRAVKQKVVVRNVALAIDTQEELPKVEKREIQVLAETEVRTLLEAAKTAPSRSRKRGYLTSFAAWYPAVVFLVYTGTRRGEALALQWTDLDLESGTATIRHSLTEVKGKPPFLKSPKNRPRANDWPIGVRGGRAARTPCRTVSRETGNRTGLHRRRVCVRKTGRPTDAIMELRRGIPGPGDSRQGDARSTARPAAHSREPTRKSQCAALGRVQASWSLLNQDDGRHLQPCVRVTGQ